MNLRNRENPEGSVSSICKEVITSLSLDPMLPNFILIQDFFKCHLAITLSSYFPNPVSCQILMKINEYTPDSFPQNIRKILLLLLCPCPPSSLLSAICVLGETAWQWTVLAQVAMENSQPTAQPLVRSFAYYSILPSLYLLSVNWT